MATNTIATTEIEFVALTFTPNRNDWFTTTATELTPETIAEMERFLALTENCEDDEYIQYYQEFSDRISDFGQFQLASEEMGLA
jgi:hypothetical protein